jgi:hypothetical protein
VEKHQWTAWSKVLIQDDCWGALFVGVADMNGDGDLDVLGAVGGAWAIAWWENTLGDGSAWALDIMNEDFPNAHWVDAADMDGDGDQDILGAASLGDQIAWWENLDGSGNSWTEHLVSVGYDGAIGAVAADVDGDGDQDLLGAALGANDITWWDNRGGQFALVTSKTAPVSLIAGHITDVLKITMAHRGRTGDTDAELATLELLFEESPGDPLTSNEANAVIDKLHVYLDNGSETFESTLDTLVTTLDTLSLTNGKQTVTFTDGDPKVQVTCCTPRTYFVAPELALDAYFQSPNQFQLTHVTEGSSTAEDQANDLPLSMEYVPSLSSPVAARPEITATVDPGVTTTLAYTDSQGASTTITVPPGAVSQTITLILSPAPEPSQPALPTLRYANHAFDLDAWKGRQLLPGFVFTEPISIGINYTDVDVLWVYEDTLRLYYWDGGTWVDAASTCSPSSSYSRDLVQNTLNVETCHLTEYNIQGGPIPSSLVYLPLIFRQATQAKMLLASPRPVLNMFLRTQP